jgi:type I restriction enzyme M protein
MARILDPEPADEIYDPACGSGGLLVKSFLRFREKYGEDTNVAPLRFYGQEINATTFAMARMNAFIYDMEAEIGIGDTMNRPAFTNADGSLRRFDKVTANPMWNQKFAITTYEHDTYGRFTNGIPPANSADWGWAQHMFASLNDRGKMAMVIDTGAVSRGSGNQGSNRERDIRKVFVERDFIEAVLLLPENLFYNTTAPGIVMVIDKSKRHPDEILLINASSEFLKGRPKNYLSEGNIKRIADAYLGWQEVHGLSKVIRIDEAVGNDYNLSPSRYVASNSKEEILRLDEVVVLLSEAEEERQAVDKELNEILSRLGLDIKTNE